MADVFLSYARHDVAAAEGAARELGKVGFSVWFDRELPAHRPYSDVIAAELESASAVLVFWSKASVESQWVRSEANRARELGKLIQARVDNVRLPMPFDQIQCADLAKWRGRTSHSAWSQVRKSIDALVGGEGVAARAAPPKVLVTRRNAIIGTGAVTAVAAGGSVFWLGQGRGRQPSPEAELLIQKGIDALQTNDAFDANDPAASSQAIALLSDATEAAPQSATAWGALALAYAVRGKGTPLSERSGFDLRSRAAARRALALDAREPRALGGLRMIDPVYRNWAAAERADREALELQPHMPLLLFLLADVLGNVGRWRDASVLAKEYDRKHFLIPGADRQIILNLWSAGDLQGADEAIRAAVEHWAQQPLIWRVQLSYLTYSGRASEALQMLSNDNRPASISRGYIAAMQVTAKALNGAGDVAAAVAKNLAYLKSSPTAVFEAAHACTALGAGEDAINLLEGYYFGEGEWSALAPRGGDYDRVTSPLFQPPMRPIWKEGRFGRLLARIGLGKYWRQSGTVPDFRKSSAAALVSQR